MKHKKLLLSVMSIVTTAALLLTPGAAMGGVRSYAVGEEAAFQGITLAKGYKDLSNHNPCVTQKFSADPGAMEYNGRVYVYATNDGDQNLQNPSENTYGQIKQINVMSSADMVNWTDHGSIDVAGAGGAASWASNSWAPCAAHKTINGKEKFFLYFANSGGGIGVLTSDSPTGPWKDPIGKALITKSTPNCSSVEWLFDPAVLVDDDGTGYLYFGGGVPKGKESAPQTHRVVKLGSDMVSLAGNPVTINAPWSFEDSGINKVGNTYYYTYCTNWNGGPYGNARIAYMTSNSPMGPFTYKGTCLNNPGDFFQTAGNNHHSIVTLNGKSYIFYHAEWLNKQMFGSQKGYRTTHVDTISFGNGQISNAKGTLTGVSQVKNLDAFTKTSGATFAWQAGVNVYGLGDTIAAYNRGDWSGVSGLDFGNGASAVKLNVASKNGAIIRMSQDSPSGKVLGYLTVPATGDNLTFTDVTCSFDKISGVKNVFFTMSDDVVISSWQFTEGSSEASNPQPSPSPSQGSTTTDPVTMDNANLLNTYGSVFDHVGTALVENEILNSSILDAASKEYNSITVGNEMKPDYILGWSSTTMSVSQAKSMGYYIPDNYTESTVPKLNFDDTDKMMKACSDKGLKMRGHTLVWHSQTPDWFFRQGFSKTGAYVSQSVMNARMEFYIKSVMNHILSGPYADTIYAWDVVNEYLHAGNTSGWQKIYGANLGPKADFVKRAFQYTYDCLDYFGKTDDVHLFYNDYNTYMEVNDVISLVNYVNSDKKICAGVGMQSHLSTDYPTVAYYKQALTAFCNQGFEVQITELDVGSSSTSLQASYYYDLMTSIHDVKKSGGNITALVWWGMTDDTSWRSKDKPLLYSTLGVKKESYNKVLQAFFDAGYAGSGNSGSSGNTSETPENTGSNVTIEDGWYYIKNINAQKYLQVADNTGKAVQNVEIGTGSGVDGQKWYVTNTSDGYITLTSKLGNFMLDVANGEDVDGANLQIYDAWGGAAQQFAVISTDQDGIYTIGTRSSNLTKVVDVYDHGTTDGTNVCQWTYYGNPNQQWKFEPVGGSESNPSQEQPQNQETTDPSEPSTNEPSQEDPGNTEPATATLPEGVTATFKVVDNWGGSFHCQIVLENNSDKTLSNWTLTFDYSNSIDNLWNAQLEGSSGSTYTVTAPSWSADLASGQSVTIDFIASGDSSATPTNYGIN